MDRLELSVRVMRIVVPDSEDGHFELDCYPLAHPSAVAGDDGIGERTPPPVIGTMKSTSSGLPRGGSAVKQKAALTNACTWRA